MVDLSSTAKHVNNEPYGPAIEDGSPEESGVSSVQPEAPAHAGGDQHAAKEKEGWEKLFDLLFQPKLFGDFQVLSPADKKVAEATVRSVLKDFPVLMETTSLGKAMLSGPLGQIEVQARLITFDTLSQANGQRAVFSMEAARAMAQLASQNPVMVKNGIRLKGTREEQELLSRAIEEVNQKLEEGKRLRILPFSAPAKDFNKDLSQKTAPAQAAPVKTTTVPQAEPAEKAESQAAEKGSGTLVDTVSETSLPEQENKTDMPAPAPKSSPRKTGQRARKTAAPRKVKKQPEQPVSPADKIEKPSFKERIRNFLSFASRYVAGFTKTTGDADKKAVSSEKRSNLSRRALLTGGSALAAAAVMLPPTPSEAAEQKPKTLFDILFPRNKNYKRQKNDAGQHSSQRGAPGKRKSETKAQRARRLKKEAAQKAAEERAERAQKAKERRKWNREAKKVESRTKKAREWIKPTPKPKKSFLGFFAKNEAGMPQSQKGKMTEVFGAKSGGVHLYNRHTKEKYYFDFGSIGTRTCTAKFNRFARDHYSGAVASMDTKLQHYVRDIVVDLRRKGHNVEQLDFISGYRTRATNKWLQKNRGGQASNSQHCLARALDLAVNGLSTKALHHSACKVGCDGVGLYAKSGFVHVDSRGHTARW